jgi:hypothetical protein
MTTATSHPEHGNTTEATLFVPFAQSALRADPYTISSFLRDRHVAR